MDEPQDSKYLVSFFDNIYQTIPKGDTSIYKVFEGIKNGKWKKEIEMVRFAVSEVEQNKLKKDLPCISVSGTFSERNGKSLKTYSGLIQIDFDKVPNPVELISRLKNDRFILAAFVSPTGTGVKAIVKSQPEKQQHKQNFQALEKYFLDTYRLSIDSKCKDICRQMFVSYDPHIYINLQGDLFHLQNTSNTICETELFDNILKGIEKKHNTYYAIGQRNEFVFRLANALNRYGVTQTFSVNEIIRRYTSSDFTESEIKATVQSAYKNILEHGKYEWKANKHMLTKITKNLRVEKKEATPVSMIENKIAPKCETVKYEKGGIQIQNGKKQWTYVADNFQIFIKYQTEDEKEQMTWVLEIRKLEDKENPVFIEVSHDEFCSAKKLKNILAKHRLSLKVSDDELIELQDFLFKKAEFKQARKIERFGFDEQSKLFFFSNAVVAVGNILMPNRFGIVEYNNLCFSIPIADYKKKKRFSLSKQEITFNKWFKLFSDAHKWENIFIPACHYIGSLYRDIVINYTKVFPILYLKGPAGTGKSSIARNLTTPFGFQQDEINLKNKSNTETALVKILSQSSNIITWLDEFDNNCPYEGLLQAAYDNGGYHKSFDSSSNKTEEVSIHSTIVLTSNYLPKNDIFFTRCIYNPINNQQRSDEQDTAFRLLSNLETEGLGCLSEELLQYRSLIEEHYLDAYTKIKSELKGRLKNEGIIDRAIQNVASILTCAFILQVNGKITMCQYTNEEDILNEFCSIGCQQIIRQHQVSNERGDLSKFFEKIQIAFDKGLIYKEVHFRFRDENNTKEIGLRFSKLFSIYVESHKGQYWENPVDKDTIQTQLAIFCEKTEWSEIRKDIRFKGSHIETKFGSADKNSCWLPYEKLVKNFAIELQTRKNKK